jgi:hypothetical protein
VQRIRAGAARIALGYEIHAPGRLTVVPVGFSFEARKRFRGRVLVSFGELVDVSSYLAAYREEPARALHTFTAIQWAMEREVVHVERIDDRTFLHEGTYDAGVTDFATRVAGPMPSSLRMSRRLTSSTRTR